MALENIIGDFRTDLCSQKGFGIKASFPSRDFREEWSRCNFLANYFAEYCAYNFDPGDKAENLISTVLNEMIERLSQLSEEDAAVTVCLRHLDQVITMEIITSFAPKEKEIYNRILEKINAGEAEALYLGNITETSEKDKLESELEFGLAMLVNDYQSRISSGEREDGRIVTQVVIDQEEFER